MKKKVERDKLIKEIEKVGMWENVSEMEAGLQNIVKKKRR